MTVSEDVFVKYQRWVSETEPELGLGKIVSVENRRIAIEYAATGVERHYAVQSAPIRRVRYAEGEMVRGRGGESFRVESIREENGLLFYHGSGRTLCEGDLCDRISLGSAKERLLGGQIDPPSLFNLRSRVWNAYHTARRSTARGFCGGRIDLMAHQFFIAAEVAGRSRARVLLADETGLGKTIEACLIMQRLIVSGRVARVLIIVPEAMVHQWFVELLRKFHLTFTIVDDDYCRRSAQSAPSENPFLGIQMGVVSLSFLASHAGRTRQAVEAAWDLLIVDEAHHLKEGSSAYHLTARLAEKVERVLLLTATPEQLGRKSHFARLKLLDPERYQDYDAYLRESENYRDTARLIEKIFSKSPLSPDDIRLLETAVPDIDISLYPDLDSARRYRILSRCVDRYGPGRVMFRNTRSSVKGFAGRRAHLVPLELPPDKAYHLERLANDFKAETETDGSRPVPDLMVDPRIDWLAALLKTLPEEKILLICTTPAKVKAIGTALSHRIQVDVALFHEELTLLQRDRNAAWFAEADGARLLICSEIGSEGRNFQFASHLVLFDLPLDPEQLEQRIGRLDRIGQKTTVEVHVPYLIGSPQEVLVRWFHEGLNQFEHYFTAGPGILETFGPMLRELACSNRQGKAERHRRLEDLLTSTAELRRELETRLTEGRDRLLQYASFQPLRARHIIKNVKSADKDHTLEKLLLLLFDHFGIETEEIGRRTYRLESGIRTDESFPLASKSQIGVTFDRETALKREEYLFLTWDHPLTGSAVEMLLQSMAGNCTVGQWSVPQAPGVILEAVFIAECICLTDLHADRFMPPTPLRVAVDPNGRPLSAQMMETLATGHIEAPPPMVLDEYLRTLGDHIPFMLTSCRKLTEARLPALNNEALSSMEELLLPELERMRELARMNTDFDPLEIQRRVEEVEALRECLSTPTLRLDALRLVVNT